MNGSFAVHLDGEKVGTMQVDKCGLFYRFDCQCMLVKPDVYTVEICCDGRKENLGILVPDGKVFKLQRQIPVKKIGEGEWLFCVKRKYKEHETVFYAVYEDKPFLHIEKLVDGYFVCRNGQSGIELKSN